MFFFVNADSQLLFFLGGREMYAMKFLGVLELFF